MGSFEFHDHYHNGYNPLSSFVALLENAVQWLNMHVFRDWPLLQLAILSLLFSLHFPEL